MKKFLVIGNPIEHSLSPTLHNYWIKQNSIDAIYEKQKLSKNELGQVILQVRNKKKGQTVNKIKCSKYKILIEKYFIRK